MSVRSDLLKRDVMRSLLTVEHRSLSPIDHPDGSVVLGKVKGAVYRRKAFEDTIIHTTTSTSWDMLHNVPHTYKGGRIVFVRCAEIYFRTTGAATAYVGFLQQYHDGLYSVGRTPSASTTSTTTVSAWVREGIPQFAYDGDLLLFRTSDSAVPAEVSREVVYESYGSLAGE
ncbi:MAG: hypothetical protein QXS32_08490 [Candidatus Nezhaarchaeales archaeon]